MSGGKGHGARPSSRLPFHSTSSPQSSVSSKTTTKSFTTADTIMSANSGFGDSEPWGASPSAASSEPTIESALEKERVIKDILQLRDGLRGLMVRVHEVDGENDKLARDNEMLSSYIDNL